MIAGLSFSRLMHSDLLPNAVFCLEPPSSPTRWKIFITAANGKPARRRYIAARLLVWSSYMS
jgi:hypothetical protein